ncbi:MAG: N-acetylmuramoyl-L-alanine amidase [bacterium]
MNKRVPRPRIIAVPMSGASHIRIIQPWYLFTICLLLVTSLFTNSADATPKLAELRSVKIKPLNGKIKLSFQLSSSTKYKVFSLPSPDRVVIDFKNTVVLPNAFKASQRDVIAPLKRIRSSPRKGNDLRVVLDMASATGVMSNIKKIKHGATVDVILSHASIKPNMAKKIQTVKEKASRYKTPSNSSNTTKAARSGQFVVVIDAGHGGKDPGAIGPAGTYEKDVVLQISKKLRDLINKQRGMRAVMTRSNDKFIGLRERIQKASEYKGNLFISVHANANRSRSVKGSSVYILSQSGASSEAARFIAARENAYFGKLNHSQFRNKNRMIRSVLLDLSKSSTLDRSYSLAKNVLGRMGKVNVLQRSGVESANFVVLKSLYIPSMLVEVAHISHPAEEKKLSQQEYQTKMAQAIFQGVKDYYVQHTPKAPRYTGKTTRYIVKAGDTLSEVSERYNIPMSRLKKINNLDSLEIQVGQKLKIPVL